MNIYIPEDAKNEWITIKNGKITDLDFESYKNYLGRQKLSGAFDSLNHSFDKYFY